MDTFLTLLNEYGAVVYLLLLGYCALKSGWLPLFAGYAAYLGALDVRVIALVTFAGGYLGDELRFVIARFFGTKWLEKPSRIGLLFCRARQLTQKYGTWYIFMYRYPKGMRTIGALPVGLTDIKWHRFTLLNASSALLWVIILVGGGYTFGATINSTGVENLTAISVLLLVIFLISLFRVWNSQPEPR